MFAWLALAACADPIAPERVGDDPGITSPPALPRRPEAWVLAGRARPGGVDLPALPGGAELLGEGCATVAVRIHGEGPPCLVERWEGPPGARLFLRSGTHAAWGTDASDHPARARWSTLGDVLGGCLGDPLDVPPARDPGGVRGYDGQDWVLAFTGANLCRLEGSVRLAAEVDRVDVGQLTAGGAPWHRGGRERAAILLTGGRTP